MIPRSSDRWLISDVYSQEQSEEIQKVIEENMETARVIIDATKADYTHLLLNQPLWEKLGGYMQYVPTTIFWTVRADR